VLQTYNYEMHSSVVVSKNRFHGFPNTLGNTFLDLDLFLLCIMYRLVDQRRRLVHYVQSCSEHGTTYYVFFKLLICVVGFLLQKQNYSLYMCTYKTNSRVYLSILNSMVLY